MMMSTESFFEMMSEKKIEELFTVRDKLIREIHRMEKQRKQPPQNMRIITFPSDDTIYQMDHEYLAMICELIVKERRRHAYEEKG